MSVHISSVFTSTNGPFSLTCRFLDSKDLALCRAVSREWEKRASSESAYRALGKNLGCDFKKVLGDSAKARLNNFATEKLSVAVRTLDLNPASTNSIRAYEILKENIDTSLTLGENDHLGPCSLLQRCIMEGDYQRVKILIEQFGVDPDKTSLEKNEKPSHPSLAFTPPLLIAISQIGLRNLPLIDGLPPRKKCAELLIRHNADVNVQDISGSTALQLAARYGERDLVKLLLVHGAKREHKDSWGRTAYDHAVQRKHTAIAKLIRNFGCMTNP